MSATAPDEVYDHVAEGAFDDVVKCGAIIPGHDQIATHLAHHDMCIVPVCEACAREGVNVLSKAIIWRLSIECGLCGVSPLDPRSFRVYRI